MEKDLIIHVTGNNNIGPGPGAYNIASSLNRPCILMKGRTSLRDRVIDVPFYRLPTTVGNVTKISLGGRTKIPGAGSFTPGPTYVPPKLGSNARKTSFGSPPKTKISSALSTFATPGPGPAAYSIRDNSFDGDGKRGVSISGAHNLMYANTISPGPAAYKPKFAAVMKKAPLIQFHTKPSQRIAQSDVPYRNLGSTLGGPKFTMKARRDDKII